jgi:hypothetical protein
MSVRDVTVNDDSLGNSKSWVLLIWVGNEFMIPFRKNNSKEEFFVALMPLADEFCFLFLFLSLLREMKHKLT